MDSSLIPVTVAVRCRPMVHRERSEGCQSAFEKLDSSVNQVQVRGDDKVYTYNYVFDECASQSDIYACCVKTIVPELFSGFNVTILAYGQTGSGKTYTMGSDVSCGGPDLHGIIPRVVEQIIENIELCKGQHTVEATVSFVEVYNEKILDLLGNRKDLVVRESGEGNVMPGICLVPVKCPNEYMNALSKGSIARSKGSTAMNETSSRSHAILTIYLKISSLVDVGAVVRAKCHLIDLAGSERLERTKATGDRQKEGININVGLFHLGRVIEALTAGVKHVPYRDHILTRLLQDSLGGNAHTLFIACVSPADSNCDETVNTLRYAEKASRIKNKPIVNIDPIGLELAKLRHENSELKARFAELIKAGGQSQQQQQQAQKETASCSKSESTTRACHNCEKLALDLDTVSNELAVEIAKKSALHQQLFEDELIRDKLTEKVEALQALFKQTSDSSFAGTDEMVLKLSTSCSEIADMLRTSCSEKTAANDDKMDDDSLQLNSEEDANGNYVSAFTERQRQLNNEMDKISQSIKEKEILASKASADSSAWDTLKGQYEKETRELSVKIKSLETEKQQLSDQLKTINNSAKISEQRRKKLAEVEAELKTVQKKFKDTEKMNNLKRQNEQQIEKLRKEIQEMKQAKVRIMKQMKADADAFRQFKLQKDKEINVLKQKDRKRDFEAMKAKQEFERQTTVWKRKNEETQALLKRLQKNQVQQAENAKTKAATKSAESSTEGSKQIRELLEKVVSYSLETEEARLQKEDLIEQRKQLVRRKVALSDADAASTETTVETKELDADIDNINQQIQELQHHILRRQSAAETMDEKLLRVDTVAYGRAVSEHLFNMMLDTQVDALKKKRQIEELQELKDSLVQTSSKLNRKVADLTKHNDKVSLELQRKLSEQDMHYRSEIAFLLRQLTETKVAGGQLNETEISRTLQIQMEELQKLENIVLHQQQRSLENVEFENELGKTVVKSKAGSSQQRALKRPAKNSGLRQRSVSSSVLLDNNRNNDSSIDFNDNSQHQQNRKRTSQRLSTKPAKFYGAETGRESLEQLSEVSDDEIDSDDTNDADYRETPLQKRIRAQRQTCGCRGDCTKRCRCRREKLTCCEACRCLDVNCQNSKSCTDNVVMNMTFTAASPDAGPSGSEHLMAAPTASVSASKEAGILGMQPTPRTSKLFPQIWK